jgi:hypothetical protein
MMADVGSIGGMNGSSTSGVPERRRELPRRDVVTAALVRDDARVSAMEPRRLPGSDGLDPGADGLDPGEDGLDPGAESRWRPLVAETPGASTATESARLPQTEQ